MAWSGLYNFLQKTQGEGEPFGAVERKLWAKSLPMASIFRQRTIKKHNI
jgi:hypothetical protein